MALTAVAALAQDRPAGWSAATHGEQAAPDYQRVFSTDRVHEIRISIPADRFAAMQADVRTVAVPFGRRGGPGGPIDFAQMFEAGVAACTGKQAGDACTAAGMAGQCGVRGGGPPMCLPAGFGRGGIQLTTRDPMYVPVTVEYEGRRWTQVAMRYKGNSSLTSLVGDDNGKLPFRLDFDRYEDESPQIENQRFYGFQELTFSANFGDDSQVRELLAGEVFRDRGVAASRAAFYRVFVDSGSGPQYWGLYTMVEDPADGAMLQAQFGTRDGNLYKPDGPGADWSRFDAAGFEKKTNARRADFTDVQSAIAALHASTTPAAEWRAGLERVFDVDLFLRWLAVNTAMNNWDVYGALAHNYYLYADPRQGGRLRWIPWDNNEAFSGGPAAFGARRGGRPGGPPGFPAPRGGGPPGGGGFPFGPNTNDVLHASVGSDWPLIQRLLADPVYQQRYRAELQRALQGLMAPDALARRARELQRLIVPFATGPQGERQTHTTISSADGFANAIDGPNGLRAVATARRQLVLNALGAAR